MRHIIDFFDITPAEWDSLYDRFEDILTRENDYRDAARGQTMASLFFEPSTRTCFSFQAAMQRLGGSVFGFTDPSATSASKGETLADTILMCAGYAHVIVMRHPKEGAALAASMFARVPVVNGGDGGHLHPTQTLADLATIRKRRGSLANLRIGLCGDLKNGRTVHSLIRALSRFPGVYFYLISPRELTVPPYIRDFCRQNNLPYVEASSLDAAIGQLDVLYMTRIQKERFIDPLEYERYKGVYILTPSKLRAARKELLILHPLPRVDEITPEVDDDPRAAYFEQARYGMYIRMSLLLHLLQTPPCAPPPVIRNPTGARLCRNPSCITAQEVYLPPREANGACAYCEKAVIS